MSAVQLLVGAAYDRRIYGFELNSTPEQDDAFIAAWNNRPNRPRFNLFVSNYADYARAVLDFYYPHAVRANWISDLGMTSPRQVAKSMMHYGRRHPELHLTTFIVPQAPGTIQRSHPVRGVAEALFRSKKYAVPIAIVSPIAVGGLALAWAAQGRIDLPVDASPMTELKPEQPKNSPATQDLAKWPP